MKKRMSLLATYLIPLVLFSESFCKPYVPPSSYKKHKSPLIKKHVVSSFDIPIYYDSSVKKWVHFFRNRGRNQFQSWVERSKNNMPLMRRIFKQYKIPIDLTYLPLIESGFYSHAKSSSKAVGYWQFLKKTGKYYGLKINWWVDERRNIIKSTKAAATYLSFLYKKFNNWHLALAAYNMGENKLSRLIRRHKTNNFRVLSLKKDFPKETREYIPQLLATLIIIKSYKMSGFKKLNFQLRSRYSLVPIPGGTDLIDFSKKVMINYHQIRKLNPELNYGFIPKNISKYLLKVPKKHYSTASYYIKNRQRALK